MDAQARIKQIQERQTPFYYYDMELLRRTLQQAGEAAGRYGYRIHYAVKANYDPRVVEAVREAGMGMDCVSGNEVRMAIESGFSAADVVFAGVGKSDREIEYSLQQGIFAFNCESLHELQVIHQIASRMGKKARVALRINPDVDPKTHRHISTGKADNKFGISYTEVDQAIATLSELSSLEIVGLHFHIGSQIRDLQVFEQLCTRVNTIKTWFAQQGVVLRHLNMGGGLGINYDDPQAELIPDFARYFEIFHQHLAVEEGQTVHFELGRSLVAQCGELITRVLYNKTTALGGKIVIVDTGMTDLIRPALYGAKHKIENLTSTEGSETYTIGGPVCESSDIFAREIELPVTSRGDLLTMRSAGAYGAAMASRYNMRDLPGAVYSDQL
ncbi:MAG: diaminopimelate decarboxylase [Alistipes sp.]|nr:diaminopimelate decarboxylase [Alistipes sp.]